MRLMLYPRRRHPRPHLRETPFVSGGASPNLSAQQTNLVRAVIGEANLAGSPLWDPAVGRKIVHPLDSSELARFRSAWRAAPIRCIRAMNDAIAGMAELRRIERYLHAAFDLEILMDHEQQRREGAELAGIPTFLGDGYTDFPVQAATQPHRRRKTIYVDKARLRTGLLGTRRRAVANHSRPLEALLCEVYISLRESLGYKEAVPKRPSGEEPVLLSESVSRREVSSRHLAILYQLRLQEAGVSSRLVKGTLHLFALKLRHAWNVVQEKDVFALLDVAFAEDDAPFVLCGGGPDEVYREASSLNRTYQPSPDSSFRYGVLKTPPE